MQRTLFTSTVVWLSLLISSYAFCQTITVKSPDSRLQFSMRIENHKATYSIKTDGKSVIESSEVGLAVSGVKYGEARRLSLGKKSVIKKAFAWRGVHRKAVHYANSAVVTVTAPTAKRNFNMEVQVFNDGVAFRYNIPSHSAGTVESELTEFVLPENTMSWWQDDLKNYEGRYRRTTLAAIKDNQAIGLPITFQVPDGSYVAINEAGLEDFAGVHLVKTTATCFNAVLAGQVKQSGKILSPWRVIQVSNSLDKLVNSDIIASLSAPPDKKLFPQGFATPWIKPGKSVWSWMTPNRSVTPENMRKFTDLAAELGIPYNLVDDGWGKWKDGDKDHWQLMKELVSYSKSKNVNIWVWAAYPDNNGLKGLADSTYMADFFKRCKDIGIVGLKVDFMSSETQDMMAFYRRALKEAAKLKLMLDFHGVNKPTGLSRTWPNEMTREAVRGLEYEEGTDYAEHNTILPFTRYLAGPGDYTPLSFQPYVAKTTLAHQVATSVIFTSPLLVLGADPETLLKSASLDFVKQIPSVWDQTVVLPFSKIGEVAGFARRSGNTWYVAVMNNKEKRSISLPLSFLPAGKYNYSSLSDDSDKANKSGRSISASDKLDISLASGGGFIAVFKGI
jgi:alpha-glucosidase